jgi:hypothetical protein
MSNKFGNTLLEQNPKLGFYTVGNKIFFNKIQALIEGTQTNQFPTWDFNNKLFEEQNWGIEPESSIKELYRIRAKQLRDQYDYIRLEASGGSDSTQVIFNFLLNNIYLDEVIFRYPKLGSGNITADPFNYKAENTLSEYEFATKPLLNWIKTNYPQVKVTIHDYLSDMVDNKDRDESWVDSTREFLQPAHTTKFVNYQTKEQRDLADSGKRVCILYGIDKPKVCIQDNKWYAYFLDFQANYANPDIGNYSNLTNEYFYWTPDMPEILLKQAHLVKNWFNQPANQHLQHLVRWPNHSIAQRTTYEHVIKPLIYPDYDQSTFQVNKPGSNFYAEMDQWFYNKFKNDKLYNSWQAGINFVSNNIDNKYFNMEQGRPIGFVGFLSPFYCLGEVQAGAVTYQKIANNVYDRF